MNVCQTFIRKFQAAAAEKQVKPTPEKINFQVLKRYLNCKCNTKQRMRLTEITLSGGTGGGGGGEEREKEREGRAQTLF